MSIYSVQNEHFTTVPGDAVLLTLLSLIDHCVRVMTVFLTGCMFQSASMYCQRLNECPVSAMMIPGTRYSCLNYNSFLIKEPRT